MSSSCSHFICKSRLDESKDQQMYWAHLKQLIAQVYDHYDEDEDEYDEKDCSDDKNSDADEDE